MVEAKIKSSVDDDLQYRSQEVKANNKKIITPVKAIDQSKIHPSVPVNENIECINELYAGLSQKKLAEHIEGSDHRLIYDLNRMQKQFKNSNSELQFCFLEFKGDSFPTNKEIEYMTDQAYIFSDITPIPMLSDTIQRITTTISTANKKLYKINHNKFEKLKKYLNSAIETIDQLNNKPIMGYIPDYRYYFDELIKLYIDKGINTFYFDAHSSNPIRLNSSLRALLRELNKHGRLEKSFIHVINLGVGRTFKKNSIIPAKDILGFGLGIDSLGEKHMRLKFNPVMLENLRKNPINHSRLFDKNTYAYLKISGKQEIKDFYPIDSGINIDEFLNLDHSDRKLQNTFNAEQLALESTHLKNKLIESKSILKYLDNKYHLRKDDIKILKKSKINYK